MNKSGKNQTGSIRHRAIAASPVDRSNIKRPAPSLEQAVSDSKSKASTSSDGMIKVKRSSMISHFNNAAPATKTSIGIKIVDSSSTNKAASTSAASKSSAASSVSKASAATSAPAVHPMLAHARAKMQQRRAMSARESAMQQMAAKRVAVSSSIQPSAGKASAQSASARPASVKSASKKAAASKASTSSELSVKERRDLAIKRALAGAERDTKNETKVNKIHFSLGRVLIALGCTAAAVFAIAYFVNLNISDFSLYAAAKQAGIESDGREPRVPQEFSITNISSEDGKITINYRNSQTEKNMTISKEKSSWDSNALLMNYAREAYNDAFATIREQGLTIYISDSNASWVNGGFVYKIEAPSGSLTKKQIRQIAVSF